MQTHEIRKRFLDHFVKAGHTEVPSASVILDDPNLLFVNAGMVQFVPYFLGARTPPYPTATSIQKCIRTPDIDEVGITTRHNTFFQMAGNFSFGDYFKRDAIALAWDLLTTNVAEGGYGLDPARLWATVYLDDDEAAGLWQEIAGLPAGADPAPRHGRQLLVDGHPRPVRPVLGDLLRPRARVRPRGRSRRQRGPLPRGLEPRVHAERTRRGHQQGGLRDPRAVAPQEHRHRHGCGADRARPAGSAQRLRDRPAAAGDRLGGRPRAARL